MMIVETLTKLILVVFSQLFPAVTVGRRSKTRRWRSTGTEKSEPVKIAFAVLHHIPADLAQQYLYSWESFACFQKHTSY